MAYDHELAGGVRKQLMAVPGFTEKEMFGDVGFLVHGNMACGVIGNDLIVRVGAPNYGEALAEEFTHPFDFTGRPMNGWITVAPKGSSAEEDLTRWVTKGLSFAKSLPKRS